jgi:predicted GNAT family acetyltransferase
VSEDFEVVQDEKAGVYAAVLGGREVGGLTYDVAGDGRLVLLATSVFPEFRRRGIATGLIRHVLDDARARGTTVTVRCPIVRTFIENNPGYADLLDPGNPGVPNRPAPHETSR